MRMKRSLGFAEARERQEAGGGSERSWWRNRTAQERETSSRADGGSTALLLKDCSRTVQAANGLMCQLPPRLPPFSHLDAAFPLNEGLCHGETNNLKDNTLDKD